MKKVHSLVLSVLLVTGGIVQAQVPYCCPQPPAGFDCPLEVFNRPDITNQIQYSWYIGATDMNVWETHVTAYIAFLHWAETNMTYEVQYKHSLADTQWLAYTRITVVRADWLTTFHPIYPCEQARFFRICTSPVIPTEYIQVADRMRTNTALAWCAIAGLNPWHRP